MRLENLLSKSGRRGLRHQGAQTGFGNVVEFYLLVRGELVAGDRTAHALVSCILGNTTAGARAQPRFPTRGHTLRLAAAHKARLHAQYIRFARRGECGADKDQSEEYGLVGEIKHECVAPAPNKTAT